MNGVKSLGLILCMLMIFMAYLKQIIPKGRAALLMKTIISVFIIVSTFEAFKSVNLSNIKAIFESEFASDANAWNKTIDLVEDGLVDEMNSFLNQHEIQAVVEEIKLVNTLDLYEFSKVIISGVDAEMARTFLSGRYQIDQLCIEVRNE